MSKTIKNNQCDIMNKIYKKHNNDANCKVEYSKFKTSLNDPSISQKMRYAQYIRSAKPTNHRLLIKSVVIPSIWRNDFFIDNQGDVYINTLVDSIPEGQYLNNTFISSILFQENNTLFSIGDNSFRNSSLIDIQIPDTVSYIGSSCFQNCNNITSIKIPTSLNDIQEFTFAESSITQVLGVENIQSIDSFAFSKCNNLKNINNFDSLTSIGDNVFESCSNLTEVNFNNIIEKIGKENFKNCIQLGEIVLPDSLTEINDNLFNGCTNLSNVILGNNVIKIGEKTFFNCSNLDNFSLPPSIITIGNNLFENTPLKSLYIPERLSSITNNCFYNCTSLTNIDIHPNSKMEQIGNYAFYLCNQLTEIDFNDTNSTNIINIGDFSFYDCNALKYFNIPINTEHIGNNAFYNCKEITSVTIPNTTTIIGDYCFYNCEKITNISFGNSLQTIPDFTCYNCNLLYSLTIGNTVSYIGENSFFNCVFLDNVNLPDSIIDINNNAFHNCSSLNNITLPPKLTYISDYLFFNCVNLTNFSFNGNIEYIGNYSFYSTNIKSFHFPSSLKHIKNNAFDRCITLSSISFENNSVEKIGEKAFLNCISISSVILPDSLTNIHVSAFRNCVRLSKVYISSYLKNRLSLTTGTQKPFYGINTDIYIVNNNISPLQLIKTDVTIDNRLFHKYEFFLQLLDNDTIYVNQLYTNITSGSIYLHPDGNEYGSINNSTIDNHSFFMIGDKKPQLIPNKVNSWNNMNKQLWFSPNMKYNSDNYPNGIKVLQFTVSNNCNGTIRYIYADESKGGVDLNFIIFNGDVVPIIPPDPEPIIFNPITLPLDIQYSNAIINNSSYVINNFYLLFSQNKRILTNRISTNITSGLVLLNDSNNDDDFDLALYSSSLTIGNITPNMIPNRISSWYNMNQHVWFAHNFNLPANNRLKILQLTLSNNTNGTLQYIYADEKHPDYAIFNLQIINGKIQ